MKNIITKCSLVLFVSVSSLCAQARSLSCKEEKTGRSVFQVVDDLGYIVGMTVNLKLNEKFEINQTPQVYSYYYGEYLFVKDTQSNGETVEIVAMKSKSKNSFEGRLNFFNEKNQQTHEFVRLICTE